MSDSIYCTYFTFYSGNKLPPFYIGSSSVDKVNDGYHGSVRSKKYQPIWKQELKEHPDLFKTSILTEHLTRPEALLKERKFHEALGVQNSSFYINQSIAGSHYFSHAGFKHTDETRKKMSKPRSAETKKKMSKPKSDEHKKKMSESMKGNQNFLGHKHTAESKKKMSEAAKGKPKSDETKKKMSKPKSDEHKKKMSESMKG